MSEAQWFPFDEVTRAKLARLEQRKYQVLITFWRRALSKNRRTWTSTQLNAAYLRLLNLYGHTGLDNTSMRREYTLAHAEVLAKERLRGFYQTSRRSNVASLRWLDSRLVRAGIDPLQVGGSLRLLRERLVAEKQIR